MRHALRLGSKRPGLAQVARWPFHPGGRFTSTGRASATGSGNNGYGKKARQSIIALGVGVAGYGTLKGNPQKQSSEEVKPSSFVSQAIEAKQSPGITGFDWRGTTHPPLDLEAATAKLSAEEASYILLGGGKDEATRFDTVRVSSNCPVEDDLAYAAVNLGQGEDWQFWGVYDGHAGWATSTVLRQSLISYVARELKQSLRGDGSDAIERAIKTSFLRLDDEIISDGLRALTDSQTHGEALSRIAPASAGSCALLVAHDKKNSVLRTACVGDSRAVLGRRNPTGLDWTTVPLSEDQTGSNEHERERLFAEHPGETQVIDPKSKRILGIMVTRAFGDNRWKWPSESITLWKEKFFGSSNRPHYLTPPYLTAEPVVTTTEVRDGDFLILATDGFWDHVSSEDAVKCVGMWVEEARKRVRSGEASLPGPTPSLSGVNIGDEEKTSGFLGYWKSKPEHFVVEDKNAATHLAKNALGGSRRELFCSAMSTQPPESRSVRDDITIQVVFFGDVLATKEAQNEVQA